MADDQLRLLLEIKGDLGETKGLLTGVRSDISAHREEERDRHEKIDSRLCSIEQSQAQMLGAASAHERGAVRQAGIIAALIAGIVTAFGSFHSSWWGK
jgi:hypothetical protein